MNNWKTKTCENCEFRIQTECRRYSPTVNTDYEINSLSCSSYSRVVNWRNNIFQNACSEYKEKEI